MKDNQRGWQAGKMFAPTEWVDVPDTITMSTDIKPAKMSNDEISQKAVNAMMDKIAAMVKAGKKAQGFTEDEHAITLVHVVYEIQSLFADLDSMDCKRALVVAIRATKNGSQMRQVAEKRGILTATQKGDAAANMADAYLNAV